MRHTRNETREKWEMGYHNNLPSLTRLHYRAWFTNASNRSSGIFRTRLTATLIIVFEFRGGNCLRSFIGLTVKLGQMFETPSGDETYLWAASNSSRISKSCATTQRMLRCAPYAKRKSQSFKTSGSGGVHADRVKTAGNFEVMLEKCWRTKAQIGNQQGKA